jgi:hypothetical protein
MSPDASHWAALKHLKAYVRYTASLSLPIATVSSSSPVIKTFVDANWGGEGSCLVHRFLSFAWGAPISWASKRQTCAARSTCQAEYMALSFALKDACFIHSLVQKFFSVDPPLILSNNKAAIHISLDCGTQKEHRHIDREFHIINELLFLKKVSLEWVATDKQKADIFTKALGWRKVSRFLEETGLKTVSHMLASIGGKVCAGCNEHTPPAIVRLSPG